MTTLIVGLPANTAPEHAAALKDQIADRLGIDVIIIAGATCFALIEEDG